MNVPALSFEYFCRLFYIWCLKYYITMLLKHLSREHKDLMLILNQQNPLFATTDVFLWDYLSTLGFMLFRYGWQIYLEN